MSGLQTKKPTKEDQSVLQEAKDLIIVALDDGKALAAELYAWAHSLHISERTLKRAKAELGIPSKKFGKAWFWRLPPEQEDQTV